MAHHVSRARDLGIDNDDADARADYDGLPDDGIGGADRRDHARRHGLQRSMIEAAGNDDRKLVSAETADEVLITHRASQALGHAADELVTDRMAQRVVHIFEMVEVDIEHRSCGADLADLLNHCLESFSKQDPVGQTAQRIVAGKVTQPCFGRRNRCSRVPHVSDDEERKHDETSEHNAGERKGAMDKIGARLGRRPGETGQHMTLRVGEIEWIVAAGHRPRINPAQIAQLQDGSEIFEHGLANELHAQDNRDAGVPSRRVLLTSGNRHGGHHRGPALECLQSGNVPRSGIAGCTGLGGRACARTLDRILELGTNGCKPIGIEAAHIGRGVDDTSRAVRDQDEIVMKE